METTFGEILGILINSVTFRVIEDENKEEISNSVRTQHMTARADLGPQTRQLMEAGASTAKATVELRAVKTRAVLRVAF